MAPFPEHVEARFKRIEFALESLAQGEAQLRDAHSQKIDELCKSAMAPRNSAEQIAEPVAREAGADEAKRKLDDAMAKLTEAEAQTQRSFDALIRTWEDWKRRRGLSQ